MLKTSWSKLSAQVCQRSSASILYHQKRTEVTLERMYPPRLYKRGETRNLKKREKVYMFIECSNHKKQGQMDVILTWNIKGLGNRADTVSVSKRLGRNHLLKCGAAVYKTPENEAYFEEERKKSCGIPRQSITGQKMVDDLAAMLLPIPMNPDVPWMLNQTHVKVACRKVGLMLSEDCIHLPEEAVSSPGEVTIHITVNGLDNVAVRAVIYSHKKDQPKPDYHVWTDTEKSLQEIIADEYERRLQPSLL